MSASLPAVLSISPPFGSIGSIGGMATAGVLVAGVLVAGVLAGSLATAGAGPASYGWDPVANPEPTGASAAHLNQTVLRWRT